MFKPKSILAVISMLSIIVSTCISGYGMEYVNGTNELNPILTKKNVSLIDWDERTYKIDLYAAHNEITKSSANIAVSLDFSGSMSWLADNPDNSENVQITTIDELNRNWEAKRTEAQKNDVTKGIEAWNYTYYVLTGGEYRPISWFSTGRNGRGEWRVVEPNNNGKSGISYDSRPYDRNKIYVKQDDVRTKIEALRDSVKLFVSCVRNSSENSYISLTPFARDNQTVIPDNIDKNVKSYLNNMRAASEFTDEIIDNIFSELMIRGGTNQYDALKKSKNILDKFKNNNKNQNIMLLFSDGEPTEHNKDMDNMASQIKQDYDFYTAGIFVDSNSNGAANLKRWAGSAGNKKSGQYSYIATTSDELVNAFEKIFVMVSENKIVDVTDYIDERFEVIGVYDGNNYSLNSIGEQNTDNSCSIIKKDNNSKNNITEVKWESTPISYKSDASDYWAWHKIIIIKAKADFVGGNNITTNVNDSSNMSGVEYNGNVIPFGQPTVNVKCSILLSDISKVLFKGENSCSLKDIEKDMISSEYGDIDISDESFEKNWYEISKSGDMVLITDENRLSQNIMNSCEYYLKVKYKNVGEPTAESNANTISSDGNVHIADGAATNVVDIGKINDKACCKVDIVAGQIVITKNIDHKYTDIKRINSNQGFIFKIKRYGVKKDSQGKEVIDYSNICEEFYETIFFDANSNELSKTAVISDLPKGFYTVTEEESWPQSYELKESSPVSGTESFIGERIDNKSDSDSNWGEQKTKPVFTGLEQKDQYLKVASGDAAEFTFSNKKIINACLRDVAGVRNIFNSYD